MVVSRQAIKDFYDSLKVVGKKIKNMGKIN
jgi:hypothetical protein